MSIHFRDLAAKAAADGTITPEEVLALRRAGWENGRITPDEAEAVFVANDTVKDAGGEWSDFFVEAVREFIVNGIEPKGYVTQEQADWLVSRIDHDGAVRSLTELELLVRIFETASSVPDSLREYALRQIERAVLTGEGPTRCGGTLEKGNVTTAEARIMRRIVFAHASARPAGVSRAEAELLFRIKDATVDADNSPEWRRLFVQGVGNFLMGFAGHTALTRERAAELEAFMDDTRSSVGGLFRRIGKEAVRGNIFDLFAKKSKGPGLEARVDAAREVDTAEKMWLEDRIDGNGKIDAYDRALLDFIAEEAGGEPADD